MRLDVNSLRAALRSMLARRLLIGTVARAALLIAVLTVVARLAGFGRIVVFGRTVGPTCLGDTYQAVNTVPNIMFEVVAGGALAGLVVPLLAGAAHTSDWSRVRAGASAMLTWTLLVLVPCAVLLAVFAEPLARALLSAKSGCGEDAVRVGSSMLRVFAPQVPLYGVGVVLTGVLQATRRFGVPALAPLLSSLVVIAAYVSFALAAPTGADVATVSTAEQLILSVGTTLGVVALTLSLLWPLARGGLRLRPRLRFPVGMAGRAAALAGGGVAGLAAQQAAVAVTLVLGNGSGVPIGQMTAFTFAQTTFLLPWAILAVPIATSVFPQLASRWEAGDRVGYTRSLARSLRVLVLGCALAAVTLMAAAEPAARVLLEGAPGRPSVAPLSVGVAALAPGLVGYGLYALLSRSLYAQGAAGVAAIATVLGWVTVGVADLILAQVLPPTDRVLALALGNTIGMTVLGGLLVLAVAHRSGTAAFAGVKRVALAAVLGAALATGAGLIARWVLSGGGVLAAAGQLVAVCTVVVAVFGAVAWWLCGSDLRALVGRGRIRDA